MTIVKVIFKVIVYLLIIGLLGFWMWQGWFDIGNNEKGIVFTFNKITAVKNSGHYWALPYPITKIVKISNNSGELSLGYKKSDKINDLYFITGDGFLFNYRLKIKSRIYDYQKFYNNHYESRFIKKICKMGINKVVLAHSFNDLLNNFSEIVLEIEDEINNSLKMSESGISVTVEDFLFNPPKKLKKVYSSFLKEIKENDELIVSQNNRKEKLLQQINSYSKTVSENISVQVKLVDKDRDARRELYNKLYKLYKKSPKLLKTFLYQNFSSKMLKDGKVIFIDPKLSLRLKDR